MCLKRLWILTALVQSNLLWIDYSSVFYIYFPYNMYTKL